MISSAADNYISTVRGLPFFYVVGDNEYCAALEDFKKRGLSVVRASDFCSKDDKFPNMDDLIDYFSTSDVDYRDNKCVVVGLGETLALKGNVEAEKELQRLKTTRLGNARVILLLRGVTPQASAVISRDMRISEQQRCYIGGDALSSISIVNVNSEMGFKKDKGIKSLLRILEDGGTGTCLTSTCLSLDYSIFPVKEISSTYVAIKYFNKAMHVPKTIGTDDYWTRLLQDVKKQNNSIDDVLEIYGYDYDFEEDFYSKCSGIEYKNWLFFFSLKQNADRIRNAYLTYVVNETDVFEEFKNNILTSIIGVSISDKKFKKYYNDRKKLVKEFPESDIAVFVTENSIEPTESIYRLTDNTLMEREAIIRWVSQYGLNDVIADVYPALASYLKKYIFDCASLSDELTDYFDMYKVQKVRNYIDNDFLNHVNAYAKSLRYTRLQTRDNAISNIKDKNDVYLYWIDALGVEYLSYIVDLARNKGLSIHVDVARAELPTITSFNRQFYEQWYGHKKYKEEELDIIKHEEKGGFFFSDDYQYPLHLASELKTIKRAIERAAIELTMHTCKSFVIASDHGASRLAVICKQEEKYETDTKGEHSGRCCKKFEGCDLPHIVEENDYIVLSDYGRFKGSRAANVEVHGGASLEEVVVPIITLTLKKQNNITIKVLNEEKIYPDRRNGTFISLYISDIESLDNVSAVINGNRFIATCNDSTHFLFCLTDIKRSSSKPYMADIYDGADLIGSISFAVKGKTGSVNDDFENLF